MKVSLNTIKQYIDFELPVVDELVAKINQQLGGVEEIIDLSAKYKDALIVRIVTAEQHPNADRLRVCTIDDGGKTPDVPRDDNGFVQVVCGTPNAEAGKIVVWLPPKSTVPASFDDDEPFILDARELRGVLSQGMLAAADELAIGSDHVGILEITEKDIPYHISSREGSTFTGLVGGSFADVFGLNDTIIDIENKMFTHRPDCFGQIGVAREIAGILGHKFTSPRWYFDAPEFKTAEGLELDVFNNAPDKVPRFMAVAIQGVAVKPSPLWLQCALVAMGSKPINNIVDVTNYVMLLTAQPTHAYDYDKLRGHKLGARLAQKGESAKLLNGKTYKFDESDIVIVDGEGIVGLGGIMGGDESEVTAGTKNIVLEVANFDMYAVRKSSMRHGIFTDALTRFNKGQSPLQNDHIMNLLMMSVNDVSPGEQASDVFDLKNKNLRAKYMRQSATPDSDPSVFDFGSMSTYLYADPDFINERLGTTFDNQDVLEMLQRVEFEAYEQPHPKGKDSVEIKSPFWRTDIEQSEDIVEEVGRLYGFDKLPRVLPRRSVKPAAKNVDRQLAQIVRDSLARAGANEVLTYSFVHENVITRAGQDPQQAYKLSNALSPDLQYYRLSITPSLLDKVHANIRAGVDEFAIFEIGKAHNKQAETDQDGLPAELARVGLVYASAKPLGGAAYYHAKALVEYLAEALGLTLIFKPLSAESDLVLAAPFEPRRRGQIVDATSGQTIGVIGEYAQTTIKNFKLPAYSAGFELLSDAIALARHNATVSYTPLSRFPSSERDICFQVATDITYQQIVDVMTDELAKTDLKTSVQPVDIYQADAASTKNVTVRVTLTSADKTLTSDDVNKAINMVAGAVKTQTNATVI